jgi:hypothetical protein
MELNLATKPRQLILRALRALIPALVDRWGDVQGFREMAAPALLREGGAALASLEEADALAEQTYRAVVRLRATHFRPIESLQSLDAVFKGLDPGVNSPTANPLLNGGLWLAYRLQGQAIQYLSSTEGRSATTKAETSLAAPPMSWLRAVTGDAQGVTLERIELAMSERLIAEQGIAGSRFNTYAIVGHILEQGRMVARHPPAMSLPDAPPRELTAEERLADALAEPARNAEVAEARARFAKLTPDETAKRFDEFKLQLLRMVAQVAQFAPAGFEPFCQAIESVLFPYPAQLEWIRPFVKPVWTNASQSTVFEGRNTQELVNQRYQQLKKAKQGNPVLLELARAFAIELGKSAQQEQAAAFLKDLDLMTEFQWPTSLEEVKAQWTKQQQAPRERAGA